VKRAWRAYIVLVGTGKTASESTADGIGGGGFDKGRRAGGKHKVRRKCREIESGLST
jgi:hypothetical protein